MNWILFLLHWMLKLNFLLDLNRSIREADIPEISLKDLSVIGNTGQKYYEVITNQKIYDHVKRILKDTPDALSDLG